MRRAEIDGPSALLAHLVRAEGAAWHDLCPTVGKGRWTASGDEPLCPIAVGTALSDFADLEEGAMVGWPLVVGPVDQPLLVVPFLAEIVVRQERPARLAWDGGTVWLDASGAISGDISLLAILEVATLHLSAGSGATTEAPVTAATTTPREAIARLNALGMKTTVPPSEKSRADAGATTNDND